MEAHNSTGQPEQYEYKVLRPEVHHTQLTTNEELHEKYLWMLSDLVDKVAGDPESRSDTLVFLDKSARPLAWMMRTFWEEIAPQERDDQGVLRTVRMPDMKFVNIDRLQWRADPQKEITDGGMRDISDDDVQGLRDIFKRGNRNLLDGKRVTIIDEQAESGDTLKVADTLFARAFPSAKIQSVAWINHPSTVSSKTGIRSYDIKEIPVWYPLKGSDKLSQDERGRGVYSPVPYSRRSETFRRRFKPESNQFITSPPKQKRILTEEEVAKIEALQAEYDSTSDTEQKNYLQEELDQLFYTNRDTKSDQLRRDIGHMLIDFWDGKITPSITTDRETIRGVPAEVYYKQRNASHRSKVS